MIAIKLFRQRIVLFHRPNRAGLLCLLLCIGLGAAMVQADSPNQAGLVVAYGDTVVTRCVEFTEDEISSYELLDRSGLDLNADLTGGQGAAICRIDGQGCSYPKDDCFCQCQDEPCIFWSYWHLDGDDWQFSNRGASNSKVSDGEVEGWVWGERSADGSGEEPPVRQFDEICAAPPTATPTLPFTSTPPPTDTPTATSTPEPTDTPTPIATPVIHRFSADQTTITAGQSVLLNWELSDAEAAFLSYNGQEEGVVSPGNKTVAPTASTVYTLIARNEGGESSMEVAITVDESPLPAATATAAASTTPAPVLAAVVEPTTPPAPAPDEPVIRFSTAASTLPVGSCTNINWSVQQADALFLDDAPVALQGAQQICPPQTQTFRLRAVYPGGEKLTELTLTVTADLSLPADAPTSAPAAVEVSPQAEPPSATSIAAVVAPIAQQATPIGPRRFTVSTVNDENESSSLWWIGGVVAAIGLFVVAPLTLIMVGWILWWVKGNQQGRAR